MPAFLKPRAFPTEQDSLFLTTHPDGTVFAPWIARGQPTAAVPGLGIHQATVVSREEAYVRVTIGTIRAAEADEPLVASGKPRYARRLGTTIFLHSLTHGIASGVELPELLLASLAPADTGGDDPAVVQRALERLYGRAWFLE